MLSLELTVGVRWLWRQRLRLTAYGLIGCDAPVNLHNQQMLFSEHQFWEHVVTDHSAPPRSAATAAADDSEPHVLPVLALNEVYVGETLSSRSTELTVIIRFVHLHATVFLSPLEFMLAALISVFL